MLKRILIAALMWPLLALAQSYPSPTFNNLTVNGTFTSTGNIGLASLAAQAANTVVANATASSASPTAIAMPSCSTSASALNWTTAGGAGALTCNTAINAAQLGGAPFAAPGPIGSTTASTGAFTTLSATGTVSGAGFTSRFATPGPIGNTTASTGAFTTLSTSGAYTPSSTAGIVGTTTNDNANAGSIGEYQSILGGSTALTSTSYVDLATLSLAAGDWDTECSVSFAPNASTTVSALVAGINTVANTNPSGPGAGTTLVSTFTTGSGQIIATPVVRESLSTTTTVRCGAQANFGTSTMNGTGFLRARRIR